VARNQTGPERAGQFQYSPFRATTTKKRIALLFYFQEESKVLLCELTVEQRTFAEDNHAIVHRFLRSRNLPRDDYYDVVVFGYLRAVREYCDHADVREKYDFGAVAWRKMLDDLAKHYKKQYRRLRKAVTVSLDSTLGEDGLLTLAETVPDTYSATEDLDAKLLWEQIAGQLTKAQIAAVRLRDAGYSNREIATKRRLQLMEIENMFADIYAIAQSLCMD
jgi:hypothetical protein